MNRLAVFVTRCDIPQDLVDLLEDRFIVECYQLPKAISRDALLEGVKNKHALWCTSLDRIDGEVLDSAGSNLKIIATTSLGFEHIDIEECKKRGITVCNAPNPLSVGAVAEITVGLMIAVGRKIIPASQAIRRGEWIHTWSPTWYVGRGLMNAVVGIVGMGRIGLAVLKRVLPFETQVLYFDVRNQIEEAEELGAHLVSFDELLQSSDYVVATCNLTPESKGLFNARAFQLMKLNAVLINTSRGAVVNLDDLFEALLTKQIKAAALDVMYPEPLPKDHRLLGLSNLVLLPHIASAEETALNHLFHVNVKNIIAVLEGKPPLTPVF